VKYGLAIESLLFSLSASYVHYCSRSTLLGPTQLPTQWVPGPVSQGVRRQGREVNHSRPSSAEVNNGGALVFIAQG
jgi:hypothetical protein